MQEVNNDFEQSQQISIADFWYVFVKRAGYIFLAAVIAFVAFFVYDKLTYDPLYSSTSMLYILRVNNENESNSSETINEINIASRVVNDCSHMIKSRAVVTAVIEELGLDISYEQLYSRITVNNPKDTRVLEIIVQANDPETAKKITDALRVKGRERITELMGFEQVRDYEAGNVIRTPCNKTDAKTYILVAAAAAVFVYAVYLIIFFADDRIRTDEDIERSLGLSVLSDVPDFNVQHKKSRKYYRGYYKYGHKYGYVNKADQEVSEDE